MVTCHRFTIVAAMVCVIAMGSTGAGWLARGSNADADSAKKIAEEMALIHEKMAALAHEEAAAEKSMSAETIKAQMKLTELQDELGLNEKQWEFKRQQTQERIKTAALRLAQVEERIQDTVDKGNPDKNELHALNQRLKLQDSTLCNLIDEHQRHLRQCAEIRREFRKHVLEAETDLRLIVSRNDRSRQERAIKRQVLLARLEQLEGQAVGLEATDRLRDLERKLDALRRELGELRRAQERQGKDEQEKPQ